MVKAFVAVALATALYAGVPNWGGDSEHEVSMLFRSGNSQVFEIGEQLKYNVRYGFISLGSITVTVYDTVDAYGGVEYLARADIKSYSGVPFVNLHHIYFSRMSSMLFSNHFEGLEKSKNAWLIMRYSFEYDSMRVIIEEGEQSSETRITDVDTLSINGFFQDGLSLLYFARGFVASDLTPTIPTLVNKDIVTTEFRFNEKRTSKKSKAVDYPVDVVEFSGKANFSGIFGMTGAFRGWFSGDIAAIPIEAKLRVLIGNITVELIEWNRPGWIPPRYTNDR
jgi:hypothetical protein